MEAIFLDTACFLKIEADLIMLVVVDFGMGNVRSILHKMAKLNISAEVSSDPEIIQYASKIILPGVGAFGAGMNNLITLGLINVLNRKVLVEKTPTLGICVGMQLFCHSSEEGDVTGLGWINAEVKHFKFPEESGLRVPHVGWNTLIIKRDNCLLHGFDTEYRFYFTHSYYVNCSENKDVVASTLYGDEFASVIHHENIYGVQFHPEKSHKKGTEIYKNFVEGC